MKTLRLLSIGVAALAASALLCAQAPMPTDRWMSNHGDYSGRRFSPLTKINTSNVNQLSMAWIFRVDGGGGANNNPRGAPLMSDGVMYFSTTDNAWALDARTGKQVLALHLGKQRRPALLQPRDGDGREHRLFRNARLQSGGAE